MALTPECPLVWFYLMRPAYYPGRKPADEPTAHYRSVAFPSIDVPYAYLQSSNGT